MPSATAAVARVTVRLWLREVSTLFRVPERRVLAAGVVAIVLAVVFGAMLALVSSSQLDSSLPDELRRTILRTAFGSSVIMTGIICTILCVTSPPRTALQSLLDLLPVSRRGAQLGQLAPLLVIGFVFSLALSGTSVAVLAKVLPEPLVVVGALALLLVGIGVVELVVVGLFQTACWAARRLLRLPQQYAATIAGALTIALTIASVIGDVFALRPERDAGVGARDLLLNRVLASLAVHPLDALAWALLLGWIAAAVALVAASSNLRGQDAASASVALLRGLRPLGGRRGAGLWFELLIGVRTPQTIVTVLAVGPFVAVVLWLSGIEFLAESAATMARGIPIVPFLLVMYAVGRTLRYRWIGSHLTAEVSWWAAPKVLAYLVLSLVLAAPVAAAEITLGMIVWTDLPDIAARALLAFACALLGGSLVPFSEEQPLSVTASGFATALLYLGAGLGLSSLIGPLGATAVSLLTLAVAGLLMLVFAAIALRHDLDDVRRA